MTRAKASRQFLWRVRIVLGCLIVIALVLISRLYYVQVMHGEEYRTEAEGQYSATPGSTQSRGDIFFTEKDGRPFVAGVMQSGYKLVIRPDVVTNPEAVFASLSEAVVLDHDRFMAGMNKGGSREQEIAARLTEQEGAAVRALNLAGVSLIRDRWRSYPGQTRAAHVLGFVGFKGHERVGRYGLERYWEDTLKRDRDALYSNFFADIFANIESIASTSTAEGNLVTTIEPIVSQRLNEVLQGINDTYTPKMVGGIVMDPRTGAIIAMEALPTFDPNIYNQVDSIAVFSNPMIENVYELGSIMKPLTMAMGLDAGVVSAETTYNDTGCIMRSEFRVCNYDHRARGVVPMQEVLNQSLNTGATFVAEKVGAERFAKYVEAFGLGSETGIDLPNEVRGQLTGLSSGSAVDLASASFGQGIAVTPIAMTRALAALANGGVLPEPHVVDRIVYPSGLSRRVWHEGETRVLTEAAAEETTRMLVRVVDEALLNGDIKQEGYSIAAKTGTAQIAESGGGYYADRYLHSFFGYFPAHDPKFLVFLYTVEPHGVQYASQTLATPFGELAEFLISYYAIPPDR